MPVLTVSIETDAPMEDPLPSAVLAVLDYTRELLDQVDPDARESGDDPVAGQAVKVLPPVVATDLRVDDYVEKTSVRLTLTSASGSTLLAVGPEVPRRTTGREPEFTLAVTLETQQLAELRDALAPAPPPEIRRLRRSGRFVPVGFPSPRFRSTTLLVAPLRVDDLSSDVLDGVFGLEAFGATARRVQPDQVAVLASLPIQQVETVGVELTGRFEFDVSVEHIDEGDAAGWLWMLSGEDTFVGLQPETSLVVPRGDVSILLPPATGTVGTDPAGPGHPGTGVAVPLDPTEHELLSDPGLFADDPGSTCRPFGNHGRIVSEHGFHTILRVEQPTIGGGQSVPPPVLVPPYNPVFPLLPAAQSLEPAGDQPTQPQPQPQPIVVRALAPMGATSLGENGVAAIKAVARQRRAWTARKSRGRYLLSGDEPLDWEGDSYPYQATSLAFGHILDYRVRQRSNGYSWGDIAGSVALAPRQTKRIVTVSSAVSDAASRSERTVARDDVNQGTTRQYGYHDQVSSTLREWSKGGSEASTTGVAAGAGFALPGFVVGGGAAHGRSNSSSWTRGGRAVAAQETQSLTDALRSHGDSVRSLNSVVVREQTQSETSQATSEVLRNANYAHSLTVIFHEILRHLRVDTELVGARECVFVPFALGPFTYERAWRWRDILAAGLRKPRLRAVMRHLDELSTDGSYVGSDVPAGPRSQHPITHLRGSLHLRLGIERPDDDDDDDDDEEQAQQVADQWSRLGPFMSTSVQAARARLRASESARDAVFQRDLAPDIARQWVDTLQLTDGNGVVLDGALDFSLASTYRFGSTVRVNFTFQPSSSTSLRRTDLTDLRVQPTRALTEGSVATLERTDYHYFTDTFDYEVSSERASDDLLTPATGAPEAALVHTALTRFESADERRELEETAAELIAHLNEHSEYYHKLLWWEMDRDKLYMMLDSLQLRPDDTRSVASVVDKDPVAVVGNSLVYAVAGGAHIKVDGHETPDALHHHYVDPTSRPEPIRVSVPTAGLYAQTIMDDCNALEEHLGSTDWILGAAEPELTEITEGLLASRRAETPDLTPSEFAAPIINLHNAATPPAPQGFGDLLGALQNAEAFRDTAGLATTQANAMGAFTGAADLASGFAAKAVELRKAEMAAKTANEKLNVVKKAKEQGLTDEAGAKEVADRVLAEMPEGESTSVSSSELEKIAETADDRQVDVEVDKPGGKAKVAPKRRSRTQPRSGLVTKDFRFTFFGLNNRLLEATWGVRIGASGQASWNDVSSDAAELRLDGVQFDPSEGLFISVFSNGSTQSSTVLSATSTFYFTAHKRFEVPAGRKVFVNVTVVSREVEHESTVQLSRGDILQTVFGEKLSVNAEILGGILSGGIETGMQLQETSTSSATSATGEIWRYKAEVPLRGLELELQEL